MTERRSDRRLAVRRRCARRQRDPVILARLNVTRPTGGRVELLFVRPEADGAWHVLHARQEREARHAPACGRCAEA